jgi:hypothetical protein
MPNLSGNSEQRFEPHKRKEKSGKTKETHKNCCAETAHINTPAKHEKVNKNQPIYIKKGLLQNLPKQKMR